MQTALAALRWIHIPFGLAGLAVFWIPLVLRKGSRWHRRVGWVFVVCMAVAGVSAFALAGVRLGLALEAGAPWSARTVAGPLFLANVALLTLTAVHHGIAALRLKGRVDADSGPGTYALPVALLAMSGASLVVGAMVRNPLLFTLPPVGVFIGWNYLTTLRRRPRERMVWWFEHMSGMLGGCIAALTAATITNARYLRPWIPAPEWAFWAAPAAFGLPLLLLWQRHDRRRFARPSAPPAADAPVPDRA